MSDQQIVKLFYQGCSIETLAGLVWKERKTLYDKGKQDAKTTRKEAHRVVEKAIYNYIQQQREEG